MKDKVIDIKELCVDFHTQGGIVKAVDHVSFDIRKGWGIRLWEIHDCYGNHAADPFSRNHQRRGSPF